MNSTFRTASKQTGLWFISLWARVGMASVTHNIYFYRLAWKVEYMTSVEQIKHQIYKHVLSEGVTIFI